MDKPKNEQSVFIKYYNHRGVIEWRWVTPIRFYFGSPAGVPEQWIMLAFCHSRQAERHFKMKDVLSWELVQSNRPPFTEENE